VRAASVLEHAALPLFNPNTRKSGVLTARISNSLSSGNDVRHHLRDLENLTIDTADLFAARIDWHGTFSTEPKMWSTIVVVFVVLIASAVALEQSESPSSAASLLIDGGPTSQSCTACKLTANLYSAELLKFLTDKQDGDHQFARDNAVVLGKTCKGDAFSSYVPVLKEVIACECERERIDSASIAHR
jgi:hypothetical protein